MKNSLLFEDMEWIVQRGGPSTSLEVDIGYMPRMELRSSAPSIDMNKTGVTSDSLIPTMDETLYNTVLKSFDPVDENIQSEKEIYDLLERTFYPFKEVCDNLFDRYVSM